MVVKMLFTGTKASISAGETLNGSLQICSTKELPAKHLTVEFVGEEYASVPVRETVRRGRPIQSRQDTQKIVRLHIDATRMNHMIHQRHAFPEGSCEVQFSITLPSLLPSSTVINHGNGCAKIEYSLRAVLKGCGTCISHRVSQVVRVQAVPAPVGATVPRFVRPRCQPVRGSCFSQGQVFVGAQAKNSLLVPGQQIDIDLALINESRSTIRNIHVVLRERVRWSAHRHSKTVMTNLVAHSLNANTAPTISKSATNLLIPKLQQDRRKEQERNLQLIAKQLRSGSNLLSFTLPPVPPQARNTHVGTRLCVTHEVIITLEPDCKKWKRNPEVRIPVRILNDCPTATATLDDSLCTVHADTEELPAEALVYSSPELETSPSGFHVETKLAGYPQPTSHHITISSSA